MSDNVCGACGGPGTHGWQRWATPEELEAARSDPDCPSVQPHDGAAMVQVVACDDHALPDQLAVQLHASTCTAPPACSCFTGET